LNALNDISYQPCNLTQLDASDLLEIVQVASDDFSLLEAGIAPADIMSNLCQANLTNDASIVNATFYQQLIRIVYTVAGVSFFCPVKLYIS
jgi:hypothetical protein